MPTLPKNPTVQDYQAYYATLSPEQQKQFRKAGLLNIINQFYLDKAETVTEDVEPEEGTITSGTFTDKRPNGRDRVFRFALKGSNNNYSLEYFPMNRQVLLEDEQNAN